MFGKQLKIFSSFLLTKSTITFTCSLWVSSLQPTKLRVDKQVTEISKTGQKMNDSSGFKFRTSYVLTPFLQTVLESSYSSYTTTGKRNKKDSWLFGQKVFIRFIVIQMNYKNFLIP
jgi:hypothetical protein